MGLRKRTLTRRDGTGSRSVPLPARRKETADAAAIGVTEVLVMKPSLRFALDNLFVLGAAFLAVSAMAFSAVAGQHREWCTAWR